MPPMSTMTATSMRTATMSTTITMLSAPHCSHMVWSFCVGTQSPCREQRNRIPSRIFGKTYVGGRDNASTLYSLTVGEWLCTAVPSPCRWVLIMTDYEKIYDFQNLYKAHTVARRSKRTTREVIEFEMNLGENLTALSDSLKNRTYRMQDYYSFAIYDPKYRMIHALHYRDRVVQHCLCDEVLAPILDKKLIYDNSACRIGKGTHFAIGRVSKFLHDFYKKNGANGYFLKCDIRKFFDNIDHLVLKQKLSKVIEDERVLTLLYLLVFWENHTCESKRINLDTQKSRSFGAV